MIESNRNVKKHRWSVGAAVLGTLLLLSNADCRAAETYKIGGVFSVTGPASFLGDPEKKSMEMAVAEINAAGGIDGRMLEAVIYDTEGDPTKAVNAVNKLISRDRVIAIIGPSLTPTTLAVIPVTEKSKVLLISCAAGIAITEPVKPTVFKTAQNDRLAVEAIYRQMKKANIKKIGVLSVANAFGESGKAQLLSQAKAYGIDVLRAESFGDKDTDMTPQLTKIRKDGPDAIVCWGTNPGPAVVARNVKQLGIDIPLYQSHGVASPKFIELAGDAADGILLPTGKILVADLLPEADPQKKELLRYVRSYQEKYKLPVSGFGGYAYDGVRLLAQALKNSAGDREKIRNGMEGIRNHVGVTGVFSFSPQDHNGLGPDAFVMVRIRKGAWELVR